MLIFYFSYISCRLVWIFNLIIYYCFALLIWEGVVYTFSQDQDFWGMALPTPLQRVLNIMFPESPGLVPWLFSLSTQLAWHLEKTGAKCTWYVWAWLKSCVSLWWGQSQSFKCLRLIVPWLGLPWSSPFPYLKAWRLNCYTSHFFWENPNIAWGWENKRISFQVASTWQQTHDVLSY